MTHVHVEVVKSIKSVAERTNRYRYFLEFVKNSLQMRKKGLQYKA